MAGEENMMDKRAFVLIVLCPQQRFVVLFRQKSNTHTKKGSGTLNFLGMTSLLCSFPNVNHYFLLFPEDFFL